MGRRQRFAVDYGLRVLHLSCRRASRHRQPSHAMAIVKLKFSEAGEYPRSCFCGWFRWIPAWIPTADRRGNHRDHGFGGSHCGGSASVPHPSWLRHRVASQTHPQERQTRRSAGSVTEMGAGQIIFSASACSRSALDSSRNVALVPPLSALRATVALPVSERGPVELSQGFQRCIASACRARRSGVQPPAIIRLQ